MSKTSKLSQALKETQDLYNSNPAFKSRVDSISKDGRTVGDPIQHVDGLVDQLPETLDFDNGNKVLDSLSENVDITTDRLEGWIRQNKSDNQIIRRIYFKTLFPVAIELIKNGGEELLQEVGSTVRISIAYAFATWYLYRVLESEYAKKDSEKDLQDSESCGTVEARNENEQNAHEHDPDSTAATEATSPIPGTRPLSPELRQKLAGLEALPDFVKEKLLDPDFEVLIQNLSDESDTAESVVDKIVQGQVRPSLGLGEVFKLIANGFEPTETHPMQFQTVGVQCDNNEPGSADKVTIFGWATEPGLDDTWEDAARNYLTRVESGDPKLFNDGRVIRGFSHLGGKRVFFHENEICTCGMTESQIQKNSNYLFNRPIVAEFRKQTAAKH